MYFHGLDIFLEDAYFWCLQELKKKTLQAENANVSSDRSQCDLCVLWDARDRTGALLTWGPTKAQQKHQHR